MSKMPSVNADNANVVQKTIVAMPIMPVGVKSKNSTTVEFFGRRLIVAVGGSQRFSSWQYRYNRRNGVVPQLSKLNVQELMPAVFENWIAQYAEMAGGNKIDRQNFKADNLQTNQK